MNYFELYEFPVSFNLDAVLLKKKFYDLSKHYHPDFYANESEEKQLEILELSTQINKAYQVLADLQKRIEYVLTLNQLLSDEGKYQLPQDFLMEMMEVNEALMELDLEPDAAVQETLSTQISDLEKGVFNELKDWIDAFDSASKQDQTNILLKIRDIWYRQKYLLRIRDSLNKFAAR